MSKTGRRWCFTGHLPADLSVAEQEMRAADLREFAVGSGLFNYLVFQVEKAPTTGALHFQGYCEISKSVRFTQLKKILKLPSAHFEVAKGSPAQNKEYCTKADTRSVGPWEIGSISKGQGQRKDLETLVDYAKAGKSIAEAYNELGAMVFKHERVFLAARRELCEIPDRQDVEVIVHWGDSGTGKTYDAVKLMEGQDYFVKESGEWWDGYRSEKQVLVDEFMGGFMKRSSLLRMLDHGKYQGEVKGGFVPIAATRFVITSNFPPEKWYDSEKYPDPTPILRRITRLVRYERIGDTVHKTVVPTEWTPPQFVAPVPVPAPVQHVVLDGSEEVIVLSDEEAAPGAPGEAAGEADASYEW